jgi:hypothetical protein
MTDTAELSSRIKISGYKCVMLVPEGQDNAVFYLKSSSAVKETLKNCCTWPCCVEIQLKMLIYFM